LSEAYETGGRGPGTINHGRNDAGGPSYGLPQLATNAGQPQRFLQNEGRRWLDEFHGARPGTPAFDNVWRAIAARESEAFADAQRAYTGRAIYTPVVTGVRQQVGLDLNARSDAVRDAAWSTAVQHGRAQMLLNQAIRATDRLVPDRRSANYDQVLINRIYDIRSQYVSAQARNPRKTEGQRQVLRSVLARYDRERRDALVMLREGGR
jgi:hypothetical protein